MVRYSWWLNLHQLNNNFLWDTDNPLILLKTKKIAMDNDEDKLITHFKDFFKILNHCSALDYANALKWPLEYMISELQIAGVVKINAHEQLTDQEQIKLLSHIIRFYELTKKNTIKAEPVKPEPSRVQDNEKSIFKFEPDLSNELNSYRSHYSEMNFDLIKVIWNDGKSDFKGDERQAIYLVYRDKLKQNIQTEYTESTVSFVKKCPFCQSVFNKDSKLCEGCGTGFSRNPSLLFYDSKEDIKEDENGEKTLN